MPAWTRAAGRSKIQRPLLCGHRLFFDDVSNSREGRTVALPKLRRYDVQAKFALTMALAAFVPLLAAVYEAWSHYDTTLHAVVYGDQGLFKFGFLGCVGAA